MITLIEVLLIHEHAIKTHGGANGTRDQNMLESAINRPFQEFGGEELYPTAYEKAAAIGESIIMNHPFVDGNKRTGYILMETVLRMHNFKINASNDSLYQFIISISTGELRFEQIVAWLQNNTQKL